MSASSLISPVLGQLTDLALWEAELTADPVAVESALISRLRQVPDRRAERGRRHPLKGTPAARARSTMRRASSGLVTTVRAL
ncbi:hypothetical protein [Streptomyces sp. NPDC001978]|uniref:hypothetical protein n=1 Tax=Streptomyces sp. NPDC001978 TaxID=3364627 RepID=UPI003686D471